MSNVITEQPPSYEEAITTNDCSTVAVISGRATTTHYNQPYPTERVTTIHIDQDNDIVPVWKMGKAPDIVTCKHCGYNTVPKLFVIYPRSIHVWSAILCVFGFFCCACVFPYCIYQNRHGQYICSNCKQLIGRTTA